MNWYIGQEIVAIDNHPQGFFKEGDTFTILALSKSDCKCNSILIDVGIKHNYKSSKCKSCGSNGLTYKGFKESRFATLDTLADISELTEVLETTKPFEV